MLKFSDKRVNLVQFSGLLQNRFENSCNNCSLLVVLVKSYRNKINKKVKPNSENGSSQTGETDSSSRERRLSKAPIVRKSQNIKVTNDSKATRYEYDRQA